MPILLTLDFGGCGSSGLSGLMGSSGELMSDASMRNSLSTVRHKPRHLGYSLREKSLCWWLNQVRSIYIPLIEYHTQKGKESITLLYIGHTSIPVQNSTETCKSSEISGTLSNRDPHTWRTIIQVLVTPNPKPQAVHPENPEP